MSKKESKKENGKAKAEGVGGVEGLWNAILSATVDKIVSYTPQVVQNGYNSLRKVMVDYVAHEVDSGFRALKTYGWDKPSAWCYRHEELVTVAIPCLLPLTLLYLL